MGKKKKRKKAGKPVSMTNQAGIRTEGGSLLSALPEEFLDMMKELLSDEYEAFLRCSRGERHYGLRINPLKISPEEFEARSSFHLTRIPWVPGAYYYEPEDIPAKHPDYAAGLYYLQEPSAMTPASRLPVRPGDRVLDLCAAPGGKATALGAALKGQGLILANDINRARARALLHNMELFGIRNGIVTAEAPYRLAERFPESFDRIMVDAPCSGEGMFRKNPAVIEAWKEKGPDYFSRIQKEIIVQAADMVRPGGMILYSTCTFSPMENEEVIRHLLDSRQEMELIPMEDYEGFSPGISSFRGEDYGQDMALCRRIWPHRMEGEGHFLALIRKKGGPVDREGIQVTKQSSEIDRSWIGDLSGIDQDQRDSLAGFFGAVRENFDVSRLDLRRDKLYYLPEEGPDMRGLECLREGLYLGEFRKKRFEPAHTYALALGKGQYDRIINIPEDDAWLTRYLRGESLPLPEGMGTVGANGFYLIVSGGHPLGFGRLINGTVKNKYPAGWRWNG